MAAGHRRGVGCAVSHFRTLTAVVEIPDDSALRYVGHAHDTAHKALESAGFTVVRLRNEHNGSGEMPPTSKEIPW